MGYGLDFIVTWRHSSRDHPQWAVLCWWFIDINPVSRMVSEILSLKHLGLSLEHLGSRDVTHCSRNHKTRYKPKAYVKRLQPNVCNLIIMRPFLGGHIMRCKPSVCLSVCLSVLWLEFTQRQKAVETSNLVKIMTRVISNWKSTFLRSKGQRSRSLETENIQIVFRAYLCEKWIDLHQTKTKIIISVQHNDARVSQIY